MVYKKEISLRALTLLAINMIFFITTLFTLACYIVSAQNLPVSITAPLTDTVFTAGGIALITWTEPHAPAISQVQLSKGSVNNLTRVIQIAMNINTADGKLSWIIPEDTPAGHDYIFELGTSPNVARTGFFTIKVFTGRSAFLNASYGNSVGSGSPTLPVISGSDAFIPKPGFVCVGLATSASVLLF